MAVSRASAATGKDSLGSAVNLLDVEVVLALNNIAQLHTLRTATAKLSQYVVSVM